MPEDLTLIIKPYLILHAQSLCLHLYTVLSVSLCDIQSLIRFIEQLLQGGMGLHLIAAADADGEVYAAGVCGNATGLTRIPDVLSQFI